MNRYDEKLHFSVAVTLASFILVMIFGFSTDERMMGLQIGLALIWLISTGFTMIGWLFRE